MATHNFDKLIKRVLTNKAFRKQLFLAKTDRQVEGALRSQKLLSSDAVEARNQVKVLRAFPWPKARRVRVVFDRIAVVFIT